MAAQGQEGRRTDPNHKARFLYGVTASCSCGWSGATWFGKGSKSNAASEWRSHLDNCKGAKF